MTKEERLKAADEWLEISKCDFTYPEAYALTNQEVEDYAAERAKEAFVKGAEAEAESKCDHKLIDVSNKFIDGGYMCVICNMTFKAHLTTH